MRSMLLPPLAALLLSACQPAPAAAPVPSPSPSPAPFGVAPSVAPVFGAVTEVRIADPERQIIYRIGENPDQKRYGLAHSYYVTVEGQTYRVHWDHAEKVRTLEVGQTVNLHPSDWATCVQPDESAPRTCHRLVYLYKNSRRIDPIVTL